MDFGFIVAGFIVGFLVGLTGVGGGSLMTPILLMFFHIKPAWLSVPTCFTHQSLKQWAFLLTAS